MSTSAIILTKSELFDQYVRQFRSICDMHGVPVGSHENLRDFMQKLTQDSHFAMDFWAFTGKVSSREGGDLSDEQMLAVVVEGIAGSGIPNTDSDLKSLVDELTALLAGVDVQSPFTNDSSPAPFPPPETDSQSNTSEPSPRYSSSQAASVSETVDHQVSSSPSAPPLSPRVVFISEPSEREARPSPSSPSPLSSSARAAFTSEPSDREADPAPSLPPRRSFSARAVFTSEPSDREATPPPALPSRRASSRAVFISESADRETDSSSTPPRAAFDAADDETDHPSSLPSHLVEALRWLQMSSLELKQHLNEIDHKMSKLDPNGEELVTDEDASKTKTRGNTDQQITPPVEVIRDHARRSTSLAQPDVWPSPELLASAFGNQWSETPRIPLENYTQPRGLHGKALFALLALGVAGSVFLLQQYGASLHATYGPGIQRTQEAIARGLGQSTDKPVTLAQPETDPNAISLAPPETDADTPPAPHLPQASRSPSTPQAAVDGLGKTLGQAAVTALSGSQVSGANLTPRPARNTPPSRPAPVQAYNSPPNALSGVANDEPIGDGITSPLSVAPSVMQNNLILSRVPLYPHTAKTNHAEGPVTVKAVISRSGTVEEVHVIEGDPLLRKAAAEAIYKWRFRPYLVNGQPVKVATTITVDFKPNR
jgi:TonB family protein